MLSYIVAKMYLHWQYMFLLVSSYIVDDDCWCRGGGVCEDVEMSDQPSAGDKLVTVYLPDNQVLLTPSDSAVHFHFKLSGYVLNVLEMLETGKSF